MSINDTSIVTKKKDFKLKSLTYCNGKKGDPITEHWLVSRSISPDAWIWHTSIDKKESEGQLSVKKDVGKII